jgi:hypothetical protein
MTSTRDYFCSFQKSCDMDDRKVVCWICEGLGPMDIWLKYCGTAGKPSSKRRKQSQPVVLEETGLLDSKKSNKGKFINIF